MNLDKITQKLIDNERFDCFWCGRQKSAEHEYDMIRVGNHDDEKCQEEFKQAIQNLSGGRKLNKSESIKMRSSKR